MTDSRWRRTHSVNTSMGWEILLPRMGARSLSVRVEPAASPRSWRSIARQSMAWCATQTNIFAADAHGRNWPVREISASVGSVASRLSDQPQRTLVVVLADRERALWSERTASERSSAVVCCRCLGPGVSTSHDRRPAASRACFFRSEPIATKMLPQQWATIKSPYYPMLAKRAEKGNDHLAPVQKHFAF
jgi:hypothetical protein